MISVDVTKLSCFGKQLEKKIITASEAMWELGNKVDVVLVSVTQHLTLERDGTLSQGFIDDDCGKIYIVCNIAVP